MRLFQLFLFQTLVFFSLFAHGQNVFSEKEYDYKRTLLPYDISYVIPLEQKQFIWLQEEKKNQMKLGRYDEYFFEKWEKELEFDAKESVPQIFLKGDSIFTYSFTDEQDKNALQLTFRSFSLNSGEEFDTVKYSFFSKPNEYHSPGILFSPDRSKFVIQNLLNSDNEFEFLVFQLGKKEPIRKHVLSNESLTNGSEIKLHLSNNGDLLLASVDVHNFKTDVYFWSPKNSDVNYIESNFFLERPGENIENINIVRQGASSYFISFSVIIEDELIGFSVLGVNVVLKTVMFTHHQNFTSDEVKEVYENFYVTSENQKKKWIEIPKALNEFKLVRSFTNENDNIILVFEELEWPVDTEGLLTTDNYPWKFKSKEDKFYFGGDVLLYCFSSSGQIRWKKAIQKTQFSQGNGLGLSFIPKMTQNQLDLLIYESSKGGNFYILSLDTSDGSLTNKINLLPERKYEFARRYSSWLSPQSLILMGIAPANINKRTLMLVEF